MSQEPMLRLALMIVLAFAAAPAQDRFLDGVLRPSEVTVRPKVVVKRNPPYLGQGLVGPEGQLRVEFIVEQDGLVREARVTQALGSKGEFEAETIAAAKAWKFQAAQKDGAPVRMVAAMVVTFRTAPARIGGPGPLLYGQAVVEGVDDDFAQGAPMFAPGMAPARVRKQVQPVYPREALREKLPLIRVQIEAVVTADGTIGDARVIQTADSRFDQAAVDAARQWQFDPATRDGRPVASRVIFEMEFRTRQD